ncbi:MAG: DMT family transporter [Euryarchaeota archaeon]|nr:DMT family transporter [Euryarchaeota archaeon]
MAHDAPAFPPRLVLLFGVLSVGVSAILIRYVDPDIPSVTIAFYRLFLTLVILSPITFTRYRREFARLSGRDLLVALGIGVMLAIHFAAWIESLFHTTVASSVIIVSLESILAALAAAVFFGERLGMRALMFILLAFSGVVLLAVGDLSADPQGRFQDPLYGDLLAFIGAVAAAVYLVGGRRMRQRLHLLPYVVIVYWMCAVVLLAIALGQGAPLSGFAAADWGLFLLMALFPTIGGHTLFNWCLRYLPAATVSTAILGEPLIASLLAALLFTEVPGPLGVVGGILALIGILGVVRGQHPSPAIDSAAEGAALGPSGRP